MPKLVNRNAHGVRTTDSDGKRYRLRPGQVIEVDGAGADALNGVNGVDSANGDDEKAWDERRGVSTGNPSDGGGLSAAVEGANTSRRAAARREAIAAPLNVVVGDDEAPKGPPTGTITTKQAAAREDADSPGGRGGFAQHEAPVEDADNPNVGDVHRQQAEARAELEAATEDLLSDAKESSTEGSRKAGARRSGGKKADKPAADEG